MHRSVGTCFVRNVLSSSKIVKRQMAARNTVGFQSKCGFSLEELQRQHQQQQVQEQCTLLLGVEAPKKSSPTRFTRYSQFSAIHRQRHKTEWFDLSPEKVIFPGTISTIELGSSVCETPCSGQPEHDGERSNDINQYFGGFSIFFAGIRCLKNLL